jgi:hypothetical protein
VQVLLANFVITHHGVGPGGYLWDENDVAMVLDIRSGRSVTP